MGCAASSLTPPNVSATSLEGDALRPVPVLTVGPVNSSALNPASHSAALACRLDKDIKVGSAKIFSSAYLSQSGLNYPPLLLVLAGVCMFEYDREVIFNFD